MFMNPDKKDKAETVHSLPLSEQFEKIRNVRELGGLRTDDGRAIRPGRLIRTAKLYRATRRDIRILNNLGLARIFDLRGSDEIAHQPDPTVRGAAWVHVPAMPDFRGTDLSAQEANQIFNSDPVYGLRAVYHEMARAEVSHDAYRLFFQEILSADGHPVLWHCAQGKDRTGVAALLLLTALGVPQETAMADYLETNRQMEPVFNSLIHPHMSPVERMQSEVAVMVRPEFLQAYIDEIERQYSSIEGYLREELGLSEQDLEQLKEAYLIA